MRIALKKRIGSASKKGQKVISKSNKSKSAYGLLINIDEVGSAKGMESQRKYAIVASKITDRFAFAEAVKTVADEHGIGHELSFSGDRALRDDVFDAIVEYIEEVDYVYAERPVGYEFELNPKQVHRKLLENMSEILCLDPGEDVLIFVDSNDDVISESAVRQILNPENSRHIVCLVLPSRYFFELQGHDFITGAVGSELNDSNPHYADVIRDRGKRIIGKKVDLKLRRKNDG